MESTTNYKEFSFLSGNRDLNPRHLESLEKSIQKDNLLHMFPIIVSENKEIIDGQHRFMAASSLGVPIYYIILEGATIESAKDINSNQRQWSLMDFVKSYAALGNEHYDFLLQMHRRYGFNASTLTALLGASSETKTVKSGEFKVSGDDFIRGEMKAIALKELGAFYPFLATSKYARYYNYMEREGVLIEAILNKVKTYPKPIKRYTDIPDIHFEMMQVLNYKTKNKIFIKFDKKKI